MTVRIGVGAGWVVVLLGLSSSPDVRVRADEPATIRQTQVQLRVGDRQFQATVLARDGDLLQVLTAAHCLGPDDAGAAAWLGQAKGEGLRAEVVSVARNPAFQPVDAGGGMVRGILGIDNEIATLRAKPAGATEAARLLAIRPAALAPTPPLGGTQRIVTVHIVDQHGREHAVRAGNHLNPKCLAWGGDHYRPAQGDSGSGVFLMVPGPGGEEHPLLIGNVAISDERGGIAPLINRRDLWVEIRHDAGPAPGADAGSP